MQEKTRNKISISIRLKIYLVIGLTLLLFLSGYIIYKYLSTQQSNLNTHIHDTEIRESINAVLETKAEFLQQISFDYAIFDWMVEFIKKPDYKQAESNITPSDMLGIDFMQISNLNEKQVYINVSSSNSEFNTCFDHNLFEELKVKRFTSFYYFTPKGLFKVVGSTVHISSDIKKKTEPGGYLLIGKLYNNEYLHKIEKSLNCSLTINRYVKGPIINSELVIPIYSYDKKYIGWIDIQKNSFFSKSIKSFNSFFELFFGVFLVILFLVLVLTYNLLILRPLGIIQTALDEQSEKIARKLMYKRDEFGMIARLIIRFFYQQKSLSDKIDKLSNNQREMKDMNALLQVQKEELETTANSLLEANNSIQLQKKSLIDNIYYASIIQNAAFLPSFDINKAFNDHFILFRPRDIVSGDFYWFKQHNGKYLIAVADCTGHGLSGSLMSMLGISFLNQILLQLYNEEYSAAGILQLLRSFVVESLHQKGQTIEVHDGMDIVLCIFDFNKMVIEFASAFNSLYLVRYDEVNDKHNLIAYRGDHIPVGIYVLNNDFTNHIIPIQKGDQIYLFTDGIIDQFGGPNDKKFMNKNFQQLLTTIAPLSMGEQKEALEITFEDWKGNNDQVDDVTVVGLRV